LSGLLTDLLAGLLAGLLVGLLVGWPTHLLASWLPGSAQVSHVSFFYFGNFLFTLATSFDFGNFFVFGNFFLR
jgi:hypothetical protein